VASEGAIAALLAALEACSREHADRVLRLRGQLPLAQANEPFEVLIFRGFSSSISHPTAHDPDQPLLPEAAVIESAELLLGPLSPGNEQQLRGPAAPQLFLDPAAWA
jgi:hypothetical protein